MKRPRTLALFLVVSGAAGAFGCGLNQEGVSPPVDSFFYPASAITDPSGRWLFVANSNADLRYNDGTLVRVDLQSAATDYGLGRYDPNNPTGWKDCPQADYVNTPLSRSGARQFCCWDQQDPNILNCDERFYIQPNPDPTVPTTTVAIGSFAAEMVLQNATAAQDACDSNAADQRRLFVAVRGDTSITWVDLPNDAAGDPTFDCGGTAGGNGLRTCDNDHRLTQGAVMLASNTMDPHPPLVPLPNEPYALAIDDYYGLLYVGHLTGDTGHPYTGGFSLFDIAPQGASLPNPPGFIAPFQSPFPANASGLFGITAFNVIPQSGQASLIYASSRYTPMVTPLGATVTCSESSGTRFRDVAAFPTGESYSTNLAGSETRGIQFVADPNDPTGPGRPFVLQRIPPALVTFDKTYDPQGSNAPATMIETCSNPTYLYQYPDPKHPIAGQSQRLLVNCYDVGLLGVFDTASPHLIREVSIGVGPAGVVFPPYSSTPQYGRQVAYVVGFGSNNISVLDLTPGSPTELHVIQRIGFPSSVPR